MTNKLPISKLKPYFKLVSETQSISIKILLFTNCLNKPQKSGRNIIFGSMKDRSKFWKNLLLSFLKIKRN